MSDVVSDRMLYDHLEQLAARQDEAAYLRCQVQLLNADAAESHTEIESIIQRLGLSLPDTDCLPDHAELAKVIQAEVVRLRAQVDQLRDEVADAKKWAMQERSKRWAMPDPLSDAERDAIEWAIKWIASSTPNGHCPKELRGLLDRTRAT